MLVAGTAIFAGCSTTSGGGTTDPAAKRKEIDAEVEGALGDLYRRNPGTRELVAKARGVLVFPKVISAGFVVGGSYGQGALRKGGASAGYYSVGAGSVGLLAGAQSRAVYVLFMTQDALKAFEARQGWTVGADASVAVMNLGADARIDSAFAQAPIIGFVQTTGGLMANISIDGTKVNKLPL